MRDFDAFWNYADPATTEEKFRSVLANSPDEDECYLAELKTQIARTLGLQRKFEEGHAMLAQIEEGVISQNAIVSTRYYLEKGRLYNSNKQVEEAIEAFKKASEIANSHKLDYYYVDALHMLGIAYKGNESLHWNEKAIEAAENTEDARTKNWLGSLYNNTAWTYFDMKEYDKALSLFEKCLAWNILKERDGAIRIAKYSIAKCYRMLHRVEEALFILDEIVVGEEDGYIYEEFAENYFIQNERALAKEYFQKTYDLLASDIWIQANEPERIARWKSFID